jgi:hypothetical protein
MMKTLADIEAAVDTLSAEQQQELFLFLAARLRAGASPLPAPREFSRAQIDAWIAEDEADFERFSRTL